MSTSMQLNSFHDTISPASTTPFPQLLLHQPIVLLCTVLVKFYSNSRTPGYSTPAQVHASTTTKIYLDYRSNDYLDYRSNDYLDYSSNDYLDYSSDDHLDYSSNDYLDHRSNNLPPGSKRSTSNGFLHPKYLLTALPRSYL